MPVFINVLGVWKEVTEPRFRVNGAWVNLNEMYTNVQGTWKSVWTAGGGSQPTSIYLVAPSATAAQLNAAISAMTGGGTLLFGEGTWNFTQPIIINRSNVTITGSGPSITKLQTAGNFGDEGIISANGTSSVPVQNGVIENLTLDGRAAQGQVSHGLRLSFAHRFDIRGLEIRNASRDGLYAPNSAIANSFMKNRVFNNMQSGMNLVTGSDDWQIEDNLVSNNALTGIKMRQSKRNTLGDNTVRNNGDLGIWLQDASNDNALVGNTVLHNTKDGIRFENSSDNDLAFNITEGNSEDNIWIASGSDGCAAFANVCQRSLWGGISVGHVGSGAGRVTICANALVDNGHDGIWSRSNTSMTTVGNQIVGNSLSSIDQSGNLESITQNITTSA